MIWSQLATLDVADVGAVRTDLTPALLGDLAPKALDLAAQVRDDAGVLGDVV